ncbi:hypothetical protein BDW69DRAFT_181406 [Aspergillus filifer]
MDTLLTFELSYDAYINSYTSNDWTPKDLQKLWHIVYDVPKSAHQVFARWEHYKQSQSIARRGLDYLYCRHSCPLRLIRLYIWDSVGCEFDTNPGWSVNFKKDEYVCTHYMVEGKTLYRYSGSVPEGSTAPPWA